MFLAFCVAARVHVALHGLPWELAPPQAARCLEQLLPDGVALTECHLPLDRRGRRTGRAHLLLDVVHDDAGSEMTADALAHTLHGRIVGGRWLEAAPSSDKAHSDARERTERHVRKIEALQAQAFLGDSAATATPPPADARDFIVLVHDTPKRVIEGTFRLNNLREGRVDLLARCCSSALFLSHGVRAHTRLHLFFVEWDVVLTLDGATIRGMTPDERSLASAMRRTLGGGEADAGLRLARASSLEEYVQAVIRARALAPRLLVLDERAPPLDELLDGEAPDEAPSDFAPHRGTMIVLGDNLGMSAREERSLRELGAVCASVGGGVPLLSSHCIVLAHASLDARATRPAARVRRADDSLAARDHAMCLES